MSEPRPVKAEMDGWVRWMKIRSPVDDDTAARLAALTLTPLGGVHVCHHVPTDPDGRDFYSMFREQNPGMTAYVGYTVFETDSIPHAWVGTCNEMDEIWVPSRFNVETFSRAGVAKEKLKVIPHGFDPEAYRPWETVPLEVGEKRGFSFLSIFEWTRRKGWDVLIRAYLEEFGPQDDVRLILRAYQGGGVIGAGARPVLEQLTDYIVDLGYNPGEIPHIEFLDKMVPSSLMPNLYRAADAFVLPTRGEGWGIPFTESMLMEVPVIASRWSGHLDFMNDENGYLIDVDGVVPVDREQVKDNPFYAGHRWAEPSLANTRALMRRVFERREEAKAKGKAARAHILKHFTIHHAAAKIARRVDALERGRKRGGALGRPGIWQQEKPPSPAPHSDRLVPDGSGCAHTDAAAPDAAAPEAGSVPDDGGAARNTCSCATNAEGQAKRTCGCDRDAGGDATRDGGNGLRVLFCVRPDLVSVPREDTQAVLSLKSRLERAGVVIDLTTHGSADVEPYDLVHIFGLDFSLAFNAAINKKPFVLSPMRWCSSRFDGESMQILSLLADWLNSREDRTLTEGLAEIRGAPLPDVPYDYDFVFSQAAAVLVSGQEEWRNISNHFPGVRRTEIVPWAFNGPHEGDPPGPDPFVSAYGVEDFVLCAGPLEPAKNQLMVLHALRDETVPVVFADGGAGLEDYEDLCLSFNRKGKTLFTGPLSREMLRSAYEAARVHVLPQWGDLLGAASLEAAWHGLPVVASSAGCARDHFGKAARYCDPCDPESVKAAVLEAVERPRDPGLTERLASYTWENQAERVLSIYGDLFERSRTREGEGDLARRAQAAQDALIRDQWQAQTYAAFERQPREALELARRLTGFKPNDPVLWFIMGSCCLMLSDYREAESHLKRCIGLKPTFNPKGYLSLALALLKQERDEEAMEVVLRCRALHPLAPVETRQVMFDYLRRATHSLTASLKAFRKAGGTFRPEDYRETPAAPEKPAAREDEPVLPSGNRE